MGGQIELGFQVEAFEQGECVCGGTGEAGDDGAAADATDFAGVALDDGLAERDLAVAGHGDGAAAAHAQDGGAVPADQIGGIVHDGGADGRGGAGRQGQGLCPWTPLPKWGSGNQAHSP